MRCVSFSHWTTRLVFPSIGVPGLRLLRSDRWVWGLVNRMGVVVLNKTSCSAFLALFSLASVASASCVDHTGKNAVLYQWKPATARWEMVDSYTVESFSLLPDDVEVYPVPVGGGGGGGGEEPQMVPQEPHAKGVETTGVSTKGVGDCRLPTIEVTAPAPPSWRHWSRHLARISPASTAYSPRMQTCVRS